MIKSIILDIDNTVYSYDHANEKAIRHVYDYCQGHFGWDYNLTADKIRRTQSEIYDYLGLGNAAIHNRLIRFQNLLEQEGLPLEPHAMGLYNTYWDNFLMYMEVSPGIHEFVTAARKKGIRIGIATDMTAHIQYRKLRQIGLLDQIDFMVTSEEAGVEKPDRRLFLRCLQKAGCRAEECMMIGDSLKKDIEGSRAVGMQALWFNPDLSTEDIECNEGVIGTFDGLDKMIL